MELVRLQAEGGGQYVNPGSSRILPVPPDPTYLADKIIEGWSSLIWTERYQEPGEFELRTPYVMDTWQSLPAGSLIAIRSSDNVMRVEDHIIKNDTDGHPELTIKGRSLDYFLEHRTIMSLTNKRYKMQKDYTPAEAAAVIIWNSVTNDSTNTNDVIEHGSASYPEDVYQSDMEMVPNSITSMSGDFGGTNTPRWVVPGHAHEQVMKFLRKQRLGLRVIRPPSTGARIISVNFDTDSSRGTITKSASSATTALRWDIYQGLDRTKGQTDRTPVVLRVDAGHIINPEYLFSIRNFKTHGEGRATPWYISRERPEGSSILKVGLSRHSLFFEPGDPDSTNEQWDFFNEIGDFLEEEMDDKYPRVAVFDGTVSPNIPYKYRSHYNLGDRITVMGEYGIEQTMAVAEYIRTEERTEEGSVEEAYPALVLPEALGPLA